jgi:hypothetical protein
VAGCEYIGGAQYTSLEPLPFLAGVEVVMCGEHHWRCEVKYSFEADARLLQWQGASSTGGGTLAGAHFNSEASSFPRP